MIWISSHVWILHVNSLGRNNDVRWYFRFLQFAHGEICSKSYLQAKCWFVAMKDFKKLYSGKLTVFALFYKLITQMSREIWYIKQKCLDDDLVVKIAYENIERII